MGDANDVTKATNAQYMRTLDVNPPSLSESTRQLLETYSGLPSEDVTQHCINIRDRAWKIFPYPCIGSYRFLDLSIGSAPEYPEILDRVRAGEALADVGCCFAQDIRKLAADGAPHDCLYGVDLRSEFFDLGYELFRDRDTLKATFIATDFFEPGSLLDGIAGAISIIYAGSFLHLFSYDAQKRAAKGLVRLLTRRPNCLILGRQLAQPQPSVRKVQDGRGEVYRHSRESFQKFWDEVALECDLRMHTDIELRERWGSEVLSMRFCVRLVE